MTVGGDVLVAGSAEYESVRRSQVARFDGVRPRAVVRCRVPEDIAQVFGFDQSVRPTKDGAPPQASKRPPA